MAPQGRGANPTHDIAYRLFDSAVDAALGRRHAGAVSTRGTDWTNVQPARLRTLVLLTLALGTTVAASWLVFGGRAAFGGPDRVLEQSWPAIYGSQALLAALYGLWVGRVEPSRVWMLTLVTGAWLGELLALTLGGNLLANELDPPVAWFYWWMATGGPLQPVAASAGGLLGWWLLRSDPSPTASES